MSNTNIAVDTALERIGDRLSPLQEFHEAAVLRFGPIVSDTLRNKYEAQVDLDKVVERHSVALVEKQAQLKAEAAEVNNSVLALEKVVKQFAALLAAKQQVMHLNTQHQQLLGQAAARYVFSPLYTHGPISPF